MTTIAVKGNGVLYAIEAIVKSFDELENSLSDVFRETLGNCETNGEDKQGNLSFNLCYREFLNSFLQLLILKSNEWAKEAPELKELIYKELSSTVAIMERNVEKQVEISKLLSIDFKKENIVH